MRPHPAFLAAALLAVCAGCATKQRPETASPVQSADAPTTPARLPDTPAARQGRAWLQVFNDADRDAYEAFLRERAPSRLDHLDSALRLREATGGFDLRKVEKSTATNLVALVEERGSDQFVRLTLTVEGAEPHVITRLELRAIPRPAEFALPHMEEGKLVAALDDKMDHDAAADRFAGAVLLARDGETLFARAYGLSDRDKEIANTLATRFRIGSMNKMFTATAVLQLVQAGKLTLEDPVGKHLANYPNEDVAAKVTIEHLLTHTGGTGDIFGPEFEEHRLELRTLEDYVELYGHRGLDFEPGSRWAYSNYGFILLGAVVEKVSGQDYYAYVREHVYEPA